ncbi:hypothetical protein BOX15_Mlig025894g2 [Macrostomum lignano]|uniref:Major facilitator superfamily (MFS) profile domain-containing protein n=1 Tax=Macrostomum lignano TaxID=282301 RepID=A0A267GQ21_9PLAT|nr:hypothetical protein BOX15_Mlig025894g2 [Macrostomum lignano]
MPGRQPGRWHRVLAVVLVSAVFFSDQMLTTVIIPIVHDQLCRAAVDHVDTADGLLGAFNSSSEACAESDVKIQSAFLVGLKGLVQIAMNPLIGKLIDLLFPAAILLVGIAADCTSILLYGLGDSYWVFLLARAVNGAGSAAIGTSGLAQVATCFTSLRMRNRAIGIANFVLFSANALGPAYGGFIYERTGRGVVFLAYLPMFAATACLLVPLLRQGLVRQRGGRPEGPAAPQSPQHPPPSQQQQPQQQDAGDAVAVSSPTSSPAAIDADHLVVPDNDNDEEVAAKRPKPTPLWRLLTDPHIAACAGGLIVANLSHNCLAATLGIWMHHRYEATDTQKGLVWLPTLPFHFAATVASVWLCNRAPAWRGWVAAGGLVLGGLACALLPFMPGKAWCTLPIGLVFASIAVLDVTLLPLLSHLVDRRHTPVYGSVSCIAHASFSIATAFGAFAAGPIFLHLGFAYLFVILCVVCLAYTPIVLFTSRLHNRQEDLCGQQQLQQRQQAEDKQKQTPSEA